MAYGLIHNTPSVKGGNMELLHCCNCDKEIERRSQNPDQRSCKGKDCQNERKRLWKAKKRADPSYREGERLARKKWRENNPDYMRKYREEHPGYVKENRRQQRWRNRLRGGETGGRSDEGVEALIVNGDGWEVMGDKGNIKRFEVSQGKVMVNSDASNPLIPLLLVPMTMVREIVKATRQGASG